MKCLKTGSLGFLWNDYQGLCYARFSHDEQIIVIVNNQEEGREVEIRLEQAGISRLEDTKLKRVVMTSAVGFTEECKEYTAAAGILKITMPAFGAVVLHHEKLTKCEADDLIRLTRTAASCGRRGCRFII